MIARPVNFPVRSSFVAVAILACLLGAGAGDDVGASTLYALADRGDVYASDDDASTWRGETALPERVAVALVSGPRVGERTLITRDGSVWRSTGDDWVAIGSLPASDVVDMTVASSGTLYVLTTTGVVFVSDDGIAWVATSALPLSDAVSITVDPDGTLYVLAQRGTVYRDGGAGFEAVASLPLSDAVSIRSRRGAICVLSATGWVLAGENAGTTWESIATLSQVGCIALTPTASGWAAATRTGDVATSADARAWTWAGTLSQTGVVALASDWSLATAVDGVLSARTLVLGAPYPNPASPGVRLVLPVRETDASSVRIEVYDLRGRRQAAVHSVPIGGGALRWSTPRLGSGTYLLRVTDGRGRQATARWVVVD